MRRWLLPIVILGGLVLFLLWRRRPPARQGNNTEGVVDVRPSGAIAGSSYAAGSYDPGSTGRLGGGENPPYEGDQGADLSKALGVVVALRYASGEQPISQILGRGVDGRGRPIDTTSRDLAPNLEKYLLERSALRLPRVAHIPDGAPMVWTYDDWRKDWHPGGKEPLDGTVSPGPRQLLEPGTSGRSEVRIGHQENKDLYYDQVHRPCSQFPLSALDLIDLRAAFELFSGQVPLTAPATADSGAWIYDVTAARDAYARGRTVTEQARDVTDEQKADAAKALSVGLAVVKIVLGAFGGDAVGKLFTAETVDKLSRALILDPIRLSIATQGVPANLMKMFEAFIGGHSELYYTSDGKPFRRRPKLFQNGFENFGWRLPWINVRGGFTQEDAIDYEHRRSQVSASAANFDPPTRNTLATRQALYVMPIMKFFDLQASLRQDPATAPTGEGFYWYENPVYGALRASVFPPTAEDRQLPGLRWDGTPRPPSGAIAARDVIGADEPLGLAPAAPPPMEPTDASQPPVISFKSTYLGGF